MSLIVTAMQDNVGFITLDNPEKRNALTESLVQELIAALAQFKASRVRVVILRAQPGTRGLVRRTRRCRAAANGTRSAGLGRSAVPAGARDRGIRGAR